MPTCHFPQAGGLETLLAGEGMPQVVSLLAGQASLPCLVAPDTALPRLLNPTVSPHPFTIPPPISLQVFFNLPLHTSLSRGYCTSREASYRLTFNSISQPPCKRS